MRSRRRGIWLLLVFWSAACTAPPPVPEIPEDPGAAVEDLALEDLASTGEEFLVEEAPTEPSEIDSRVFRPKVESDEAQADGEPEAERREVEREDRWFWESPRSDEKADVAESETAPAEVDEDRSPEEIVAAEPPAEEPIAAEPPTPSAPVSVVPEIRAAPLPTEGNFLVSLYDAFGMPQDGLVQRFGFSTLIRYRGKTILFDAGSDAATFRHNVRVLGVRLSEVDFAVLSHNHPDHFSGFPYFREVNSRAPIYAPADPMLGGHMPFDVRGAVPEVALGLPAEQRYYGGDESRMNGFDSSGVLGADNVVYLEKSLEVAPGITLVLSQSETSGYVLPPGSGREEPQRVNLPELSLSLSTVEGEALVVGCSHSGVETIIVQTRSLLQRPVYLVAGGFHLIPQGADFIRPLADWMRNKQAIRAVAPAHCTGHLGFAIFREVYGDRYRFFGLGSRISLAP